MVRSIKSILTTYMALSSIISVCSQGDLTKKPLFLKFSSLFFKWLTVVENRGCLKVVCNFKSSRKHLIESSGDKVVGCEPAPWCCSRPLTCYSAFRGSPPQMCSHPLKANDCNGILKQFSIRLPRTTDRTVRINVCMTFKKRYFSPRVVQLYCKVFRWASWAQAGIRMVSALGQHNLDNERPQSGHWGLSK